MHAADLAIIWQDRYRATVHGKDVSLDPPAGSNTAHGSGLLLAGKGWFSNSAAEPATVGIKWAAYREQIHIRHTWAREGIVICWASVKIDMSESGHC